MTDPQDKLASLRKWADRLRSEFPGMAAELAEYADAWEAERAESAEETRKLRTVMVAAAEEIQEHWAAHCDAEGYGPQNLLHRLEEGIATEYGYTAGAFAAKDARIAEQDEEIARLRAESTRAYAEGRGDQYEDDCVTAQLLFENLDDVDVCGDGRINTTRVRELMGHFELPRPAECSYPTCTRAECEGLGCVADRINTERERRIAVVVQGAQEKTQ